MKKIGSGVQYNVWDMGNGKVKKIQTTFLQKIYRFHKIAPKYKIYSHLINNIKTSISAGKQTKESAEDLKKHLLNIDARLLGNPIIQKDGNYEQDKVLQFGEKLNSCDFTEQKELINKYLDNLISCWDYAFSDTVFNFIINSGVTPEDKVILIDLGELTWNKNDVKKLVETKHWEKRSSFNKLDEGELKDYIRKQFNEKVTVLNLDSHWNSKTSSNILH